MDKKYKYIILIVCLISLLFPPTYQCFAETELPEGTVAGLPENLTIMDSDGNSASISTGEYFFEVSDMTPGETYSKDVQIMNLREDKAYHIYFYAEPVDDNGEIDLKNGCTATITLDGEEIYQGIVTGEGEHDLANNPIDLGSYAPGQGKVLNCSVVWNEEDTGGFIDYGHRLIDENGTTVLREASGKNYISGEVRFKWIFYAVVDDTYTPPQTGLSAMSTTTEIIVLFILAVMICGMIALIIVKKKHGRTEQ